MQSVCKYIFRFLMYLCLFIAFGPSLSLAQEYSPESTITFESMCTDGTYVTVNDPSLCDGAPSCSFCNNCNDGKLVTPNHGGDEQCEDGNMPANIPANQGFLPPGYDPATCYCENCRIVCPCGNGKFDGNETCDFDENGNPIYKNHPGQIGIACRLPGTIGECTYCPDGNDDGDAAGEECDDGNNIENDGCNNSCQPPCGDNNALNDGPHGCDRVNGVVTYAPGVPDNNMTSCNLDTCEASFCGDGFWHEELTPLEPDCDDGNDIDDDECSNNCERNNSGIKISEYVTLGRHFAVFPGISLTGPRKNCDDLNNALTGFVINKNVLPDSQPVYFNYIVSNSGSTRLDNVVVNDVSESVPLNLSAPRVLTGDSSGDGTATLDPLEQWLYRAETTVGQLPYRLHRDVATVTANVFGKATAGDPLTDSDNANFCIVGCNDTLFDSSTEECDATAPATAGNNSGLCDDQCELRDPPVVVTIKEVSRDDGSTPWLPINVSDAVCADASQLEYGVNYFYEGDELRFRYKIDTGSDTTRVTNVVATDTVPGLFSHTIPSLTGDSGFIDANRTITATGSVHTNTVNITTDEGVTATATVRVCVKPRPTIVPVKEYSLEGSNSWHSKNISASVCANSDSLVYGEDYVYEGDTLSFRYQIGTGGVEVTNIEAKDDGLLDHRIPRLNGDSGFIAADDTVTASGNAHTNTVTVTADGGLTADATVRLCVKPRPAITVIKEYSLLNSNSWHRKNVSAVECANSDSLIYGEDYVYEGDELSFRYQIGAGGLVTNVEAKDDGLLDHTIASLTGDSGFIAADDTVTASGSAHTNTVTVTADGGLTADATVRLCVRPRPTITPVKEYSLTGSNAWFSKNISDSVCANSDSLVYGEDYVYEGDELSFRYQIGTGGLEVTNVEAKDDGLLDHTIPSLTGDSGVIAADDTVIASGNSHTNTVTVTADGGLTADATVRLCVKPRPDITVVKEYSLLNSDSWHSKNVSASVCADDSADLVYGEDYVYEGDELSFRYQIGAGGVVTNVEARDGNLLNHDIASLTGDSGIIEAAETVTASGNAHTNTVRVTADGGLTAEATVRLCVRPRPTITPVKEYSLTGSNAWFNKNVSDSVCANSDSLVYGEDYVYEGDELSFRYQISTGGLEVTGIEARDGSLLNHDIASLTGDSGIIEAAETVTASGNAHTNTVTVTADGGLTAQATVRLCVKPRPDITVSKEYSLLNANSWHSKNVNASTCANSESLVHGEDYFYEGDEIQFRYRIDAGDDVTVTNVAALDTVEGLLDHTIPSLTGESGIINGETTVTASGTFHTNTVNVTADGGVSANATVRVCVRPRVEIEPEASITIEKSVDTFNGYDDGDEEDDDGFDGYKENRNCYDYTKLDENFLLPQGIEAEGGELIFTFKIKNTGSVEFEEIVLSDDFFGSDSVSDGNWLEEVGEDLEGSLEPGEEIEITVRVRLDDIAAEDVPYFDLLDELEERLHTNQATVTGRWQATVEDSDTPQIVWREVTAVDQINFCVNECGDGVAQGVEECDGDDYVADNIDTSPDGKDTSNWRCYGNCQGGCGDGRWQSWEMCEKNAAVGDFDNGYDPDCNEFCRIPSDDDCPDGILQQGEACEPTTCDGDFFDPEENEDGCDGTVALAQFWPNTPAGTACSETCGLIPPGGGNNPICGDGIIQVGEACDPGNQAAGIPAILPNGIVLTECVQSCENYSDLSLDECDQICTLLSGCNDDCTLDPICGNNQLDSAIGELCDYVDGVPVFLDPSQNATNTICSSTCVPLTECGNGVLDFGEDCDCDSVTGACEYGDDAPEDAECDEWCRYDDGGAPPPPPFIDVCSQIRHVGATASCYAHASETFEWNLEASGYNVLAAINDIIAKRKADDTTGGNPPIISIEPCDITLNSFERFDDVTLQTWNSKPMAGENPPVLPPNQEVNVHCCVLVGAVSADESCCPETHVPRQNDPFEYQNRYRPYDILPYEPGKPGFDCVPRSGSEDPDNIIKGRP